MSFAYIFIIFATLYIVALGSFYFVDKFKKPDKTVIKTDATQTTQISKTGESLEANTLPKVDIAGGLLFLVSSLNEDAQKKGNYVLLDYDIAYPRLFYADIATLTKLIDSIAQIFLLNVSNSTVTIKFLLSNYYKSNIRFAISVHCDRAFFTYKNTPRININAKSRKFYEIAKTIAKQNNSSIRFEFDHGVRICTYISLHICDDKIDLIKSLKIKNPKKISALVAEPNLYAFNILKKDLEFIGIDVKPSGDWSIIKRHIEDMIFHPNIVFIKESLLSEINDALVAILIEKKIALVVLKTTNSAVNLNPKIRVWTLDQPYLSDTLVHILNEAYEFETQNGDKI